MSAPVIGIVGYHHAVPRAFGTLHVSGAPTSYVDAVRAAGGVPVLLPQDDAAALLGVVDGVVLTGGGDLDPRWYAGSGPAEAVDVDRDEAELALARTVLDTRLPVLGVCRGLQVLAVASGGSLHRVAGHTLPEAGHEVRTAPGSTLHALLGDRVRTSALHHQAIAGPGAGWRPTAWTADGVVEAIEPVDPACRALGVQWHPELSGAPFHDATGSAIFGWLVSTSTGERHGRQVLAGSR